MSSCDRIKTGYKYQICIVKSRKLNNFQAPVLTIPPLKSQAFSEKYYSEKIIQSSEEINRAAHFLHSSEICLCSREKLGAYEKCHINQKENFNASSCLSFPRVRSSKHLKMLLRDVESIYLGFSREYL